MSMINNLHPKGDTSVFQGRFGVRKEIPGRHLTPFLMWLAHRGCRSSRSERGLRDISYVSFGTPEKGYVRVVCLYVVESFQYLKLRVSEDAGIGHNMHDIYTPIA
jgi:hypothetical protein